MTRPSVLVVSDVPLIREGLFRLVEQMPDVTFAGAVGNVPALLARLGSVHADAVILHERLDPTFNAVALLARRRFPAVIVLLDRESRASAALAAGACSAVSSSAPIAALMAAVRRASQLPVTTVPTRMPWGPGGVLSPRETEILRMIAKGKDNRVIADDLVLSIETVRTHAKNVAKKLGVRRRCEVVMVAYQMGFTH